MIERYDCPEMSEIWTDEFKYKCWESVELAVLRAQAEMNLIPQTAFERISTQIAWSKEDIGREEERCKHDFLAFLTVCQRSVGEPEASLIHQGLTSSDIVDTGLALQMGKAADLIIGQAKSLAVAISNRLPAFSALAMCGRTHGQVAEPITLGVKFAGFLAELYRSTWAFDSMTQYVSVGKLSGAVGVYTHVSAEVEQKALRSLNLQPEQVATQVVPRDRHAWFVFALSELALCVERMAQCIRTLQRTEIGELAEGFAHGQKGSSAMPHKRNPIVSENLCGLSRVVRGFVSVAQENQLLWDERDISHSSAERMMLPDVCGIVYYMLKKATALVVNLEPDAAAMRRNLAISAHSATSSAVLVALMQEKIDRDSAYLAIQAASPNGRLDVAEFVSGAFFRGLPPNAQAAARKASEVTVQHILDRCTKIVDRVRDLQWPRMGRFDLSHEIR